MYEQYNNNEVVLAPTTEYLLSKNHIDCLISMFIDIVPDTELYGETSLTGRPQYLPAMMLKILLCAYTRKTCSGRKIQQMIEENIAMMWLIGDADGVFSYRTINRFRTSLQMTKLIQKAFVRFRQLLVDNAMIDNKVFIDGTKINASSNKYSFVWRKSSEKYEQQLGEKLPKFL